MMKRLLPLALALLILTGCAGPAAERNEMAQYRQIGMEEAISLMESEENYVLLDVRTEAEFEAKHIPGAICIPNEIIADEPPEALPDKEQLILVYCRSGNRSKQASIKLASMGYSNIVEFGGILDWPGETVSGDD